MAGEDNRAPLGPPEDPRQGRNTAFLVVVFLIAILIRAVAAWQSGVASPQEIRYITIAQGLLQGRGFSGIDARFPDLIQPPVYSVLLALVMLPGFDPLVASRGVTILVGALLMFPLAAFARRVFDRATARRTAWLVAFYPLLVNISSISMTEPIFTLFVVLAALCVLRAYGGDRELRNISLAGILLGLAFLSRPEGVADSVATTVLLAYWAWRWKRKEVGRALLLATLPVLLTVLVAAPYWVWLHGKTGRWLLAPKIALTQVHQEIMNRGVREQWPEKYGSILFYERVKFGLDEDGNDLLSADAFRELGLIPDGGTTVHAGGPTLAPGATRHLASVVWRNVKQIYLDTIKYGLVLPTALLGFLALGVTSRPWRSGRERYGQAILLWYAFSGCSWILSYVQPRFLYPSIVFLLPWMAEGWGRTETWILDSLNPEGLRRSRAVREGIGLGLLALVMAACLIHLPPAVKIFSSLWTEHRTAGEFLRESGAEPGPIMSLTPVTAFYSGFPFEILPYADLDRVLTFARGKKVRYVVADMAEFPRFRPQLLSLFDTSHAPSGLRLVRDLNEMPDRRIVVYELLPQDSQPGPPSPVRQ